MTEYQYRVTGICPANLRPAMNAIGEALKYGGGGFHMPLYQEGDTTITHYATSTVATANFVALLTDADTQDVVLASIDWTEWGFADEEEVRLILRAQKYADPAQLVIGPRTDNGRDQLDQLMQAHSLSMEPVPDDGDLI